MGWAGGSELVSRVAKRVLAVVGDSVDRRMIYEELVDAATDHDWDCLDEAEGIDPILDEVLWTHLPNDYGAEDYEDGE